MAVLIWILPVLVFLIGAGLAGILIYFAVRFHRRGGAVADMRATTVDKLRPGPAKIKARVYAREDLLSSPLGNHPCLYYRFLVREMRATGGRHGGHTMVTVVDDAKSIEVVLEDDTGKVNIDLRDAEVVLKASNFQTSGTFKDAPEELEQLLRRRYGRSTKGLLFNKSMTYIETYLPDESRVIVVGEVERGKDGLLTFRRGDTPLMLGDRDDNQLRTPYRRKAMYCWIGAAVLLFLTLGMTFGAGMIAAFVSVAATVVSNNPAPTTGTGLDQQIADLRSANMLTRKSAAEKIAQTPVDEARRNEVRRALEPLIRDENFFIASAALKALQKWGNKESVPALVQALKQPGGPARRELMETLAKFPGPQTADALTDALATPADRHSAAAALRSMGPAAEPSVLRQLQGNADPSVQREDCNILADIGTPASLPALEPLAKKQEFFVAPSARQAMNAIQARNPGR